VNTGDQRQFKLFLPTERKQVQIQGAVANIILKIAQVLSYLIHGRKEELLQFEFPTSLSICLVINFLKLSAILC
jgi:hypothetical protein